MKTSLIVAMGANNVIGREGGLPWHLSGDLKFFKAKTMGKPVIMGRKTYTSIGKALPGRVNIVISRDTEFSAENCVMVTSIEQALELGQSLALAQSKDEVMVIGGAQIYAETLALADRLYITEVDASPEGDAYFPAIDKSIWEESWSEVATPLEGKDDHDYTFKIYDRKS